MPHFGTVGYIARVCAEVVVWVPPRVALVGVMA